MIKEVLAAEVQAFIREHENEDPFQLTLKYKEVAGIPIQLISEQISSRKKAKSKLPTWYAAENIILPPKLSMEQCSSEITATYKATIINGNRFVDLTGGAGVDAWAIFKSFAEGAYVEQNQELTKIALSNFKSLLVPELKVHQGLAEEYLKIISEKVDCIYIDPARRDVHKNRVFLLEDCTPNITELLPALKSKAHNLLIKTSPMMDIDLSLKSLGGVSEVHVVAVENDCKEVLYLIKKNGAEDPQIKTINFKKDSTEVFDFRFSQRAAHVSYAEPQQFLYEPNAAVLKSGAFNLICRSFGVKKLHANTHLYTSESLIENFPGRAFRIRSFPVYSKKELKRAVTNSKANVAVRNFKDDVTTIRKKTGLKDGGESYLFGFTDINNNQRLALCTKA